MSMFSNVFGDQDLELNDKQKNEIMDTLAEFALLKRSVKTSNYKFCDHNLLIRVR